MTWPCLDHEGAVQSDTPDSVIVRPSLGWLKEDKEFSGDALLRLVLDIEAAVGSNRAGMTPLGMAVTSLAEEAWRRDCDPARHQMTESGGKEQTNSRDTKPSTDGTNG